MFTNLALLGGNTAVPNWSPIDARFNHSSRQLGRQILCLLALKSNAPLVCLARQSKDGCTVAPLRQQKRVAPIGIRCDEFHRYFVVQRQTNVDVGGKPVGNKKASLISITTGLFTNVMLAIHRQNRLKIEHEILPERRSILK